jgi:hypothetical protein
MQMGITSETKPWKLILLIEFCACVLLEIACSYDSEPLLYLAIALAFSGLMFGNQKYFFKLFIRK